MSAHSNDTGLVPTRPAQTSGGEQCRRGLAVVGSTGSIGRSTLAVVRRNPERFFIVGLVANRNVALLTEQVAEFRPRVAVLVAGTAEDCATVQAASPATQVFSGSAAAIDLVAASDVDTVMAAIVGLAGVRTTLAALDAGKTVALANKESLVSAANLVRASLARGGGQLIPVDSEHSAIFQVLQGERPADLLQIILTASGGPFLDRSPATFNTISPAEAVRHPRWSMGAKISVDSATLFNKALELIEAAYLFGLPEDKIGVLVHPQSIIHSLIELRDRSLLAQLSVPDMVGAIGYALGYPNGRPDGGMAPLDLAALGALTFRPLDGAAFPSVSLARAALRSGGNAPAVLSIANEVAVARFLKGQLTFQAIPQFVESSLEYFAGAAANDIVVLERLEQEIALRAD